MIIEIVNPQLGQVVAVVKTSKPTVSARFLVQLANDYNKGLLKPVTILHGNN